ncbi:DUF3048 domain-containing protein [Patescibacteria group bacterium AH-259-L05]|nr:DUF3048 domain-containing protein [Patescibacteria group bacterium AH-259-L05]
MHLIRQKKTILIIAGLFLIILFIFVSRSGKDTSMVQKQQDTEAYTPQFLKLPISMVLDNFKDARPLSGIENASIIYEVPVEGDITRFLGIYNQESLPDKIGPIRSARPYFVEWAEEYGALFVHVGGSPKGLDTLRQSQYIPYSINEMSSHRIYFWRDGQRSMPHNTYTSAQLIVNVIEQKTLISEPRSDFKSWSFKSESRHPTLEYTSDEIEPSQLPRLSQILKIDYREPVIWQYREVENVYVRHQNGEVFVGENNSEVHAKNIVIQITDIVPIDSLDRRTIRTTGAGNALIFQQGIVIRGTWIRQDQSARTIFYDENGKEIEFVLGNIWINIVSPDHRILY